MGLNVNFYNTNDFIPYPVLIISYMGSQHMPINLTEQVAPKTIKMNFIAIKDPNFSFWGHCKILT